MASYFTGMVVAGIVVATMLGIVNFAQESEVQTTERRVGTLKDDELLNTAADPDAPGQVEAILQLGETPGDLNKTIPILGDLLMGSPESLPNIAARITAKNIGPDGAEHCRPLIESGDASQVTRGWAAVRWLGGGEIFLPEIKKMLSSGKPKDRQYALFALQGIGDEGMEVMDLVIEALDDEDFNTQRWACQVLEQYGANAMPAEKKILNLMETGNPSTKSQASIVLGSIGPTDDTDTAAVLGEKLNKFTQIEKQRALLGIVHLGAEAKSIEDKVRQAMLTQNKRVMPFAAYALWKITGDPDESIESFKQYITNPSYREDVMEFAGKMQADGAPMVEDIMAALENPDEDVTLEVGIAALGNIGPPAAKATDTIKSFLKHDDALIRYYAKEALQKINGANEGKQEEK